MTLLTQRHYSIILLLQNVLLLFDIAVNSFSSFATAYPVDLLVLYVVQDFCLIASLTILLVNFFSTHIFQAGLIQLLYTKFRMTLILCIIYIIISVSLHTWHLTVYWPQPLDFYWTKGFHAFYSLHKTVAVFYYYFYKRAALRIADPRFYEASIWLQGQSSYY